MSVRSLEFVECGHAEVRLPMVEVSTELAARIEREIERRTTGIVIPGRSSERTRNLEIPGLVLRTILE